MARGVNKVILVGNLGRDPEVRYSPAGNAVTNASLATSQSWKDRDGERQERTEWHRVVFFDRLAEVAGQHLAKGAKVYIEGELRTRKWQTDAGEDRYTTEIVARELEMLDSPAAAPGRGGAANGARARYDHGPALAPRAAAPARAADFDDDIPF